MGLFRKMTSISTLGTVDFRSDKERIARYTKQTRNATRALVDQQSDEMAEFREFQHWKADRARSGPTTARPAVRPDPARNDDEEAVAQQERERRQREQLALERAELAKRRADKTRPPWLEAVVGGCLALCGLLLIIFIALEIFGVRLGWWWALVVVLAVVCSPFVQEDSAT